MSLKLLKEHIKTGELLSAYVFWGSEDYLLSHYLKNMTDKLIKPDFAQFNHQIFDAKRLDINLLSDSAVTYPVFDERKIIIIDGLLPPVFNAQLAKQLEKLIPDMPAGNTLIFTYEPEVDFDKKNVALKNFFQKAGVVSVKFEPPSGRELMTWVARHFAAQGKEISQSDITYLLEVCDNTMSALVNEIEKICRYTLVSRVERRHIDAVAIKSTEARVYELTDAVAARRLGQSLAILNDLLSQKTDHVYILSAIGSVFSSLYKIKVCLRSNQGRAEMLKRTGLRPGLLDRYIRLSDGFSDKDLTFALTACAQCDVQLKSSRMDKDIILELLIATLSEKRGEAV